MNTHHHIKQFVSDCEAKMYELHANCLCHRNPPPITTEVSDEKTYSSGPNARLEKGTETLGRYMESNRITIFQQSIANFARDSGLDEDLVTQVVCIHETAHSVTNLGLYNGKTWQNWDKESSDDDAEKYAQLATWLYLTKYGTPDLMETFKAMSGKSPPRYQTWEDSVGKPPREFDEVLDDYKVHLLADSGREVIRPIIGYPLEE